MMNRDENAKKPQGGNAAKESQPRTGKIKSSSVKAIGLHAEEVDGKTQFIIASDNFDTEMILLDMLVDDLEVLCVEQFEYENAPKNTPGRVELHVLTNISWKEYDNTPWYHWMDAVIDA